MNFQFPTITRDLNLSRNFFFHKGKYWMSLIKSVCSPDVTRSVSAKYQTENMFTCIVITWNTSSSLSSSSIVRRKLLQRSTPLKLLGQLKPNLVTIVLGWSPLKTVSGKSTRHQRWPPPRDIF
jgi:hypothetical protein